MAIFYIRRASNIGKWESDYSDIDDEMLHSVNGVERGNIYDIYPITSCKEFYDPLLVTKLKKELYEDCDSECLNQGTQWSTIYAMNGTILAMLCVTYAIYAVGSHIFAARVLAAWLNFFLGWVHFIAIIMTWVLRYRTQGLLASNCLDKAEWNGVGKAMGDWTFEDDSNQILVITIIQSFLMFALCCLGSYPLRIKPQGELEKLSELAQSSEAAVQKSEVSAPFEASKRDAPSLNIKVDLGKAHSAMAPVDDNTQ